MDLWGEKAGWVLFARSWCEFCGRLVGNYAARDLMCAHRASTWSSRLLYTSPLVVGVGADETAAPKIIAKMMEEP